MSNTTTSDQSHRPRKQQVQHALGVFLAVVTLAYIGTVVTTISLSGPEALADTAVWVAILLANYGWAPILFVTVYILYRERE